MYYNPTTYKPSKKELKWREITSIVYARDNYVCRLFPILSTSEKEQLQSNAQYLINIIDPAHVIRVGSSPHMKYEVENIVLLNRYSHSQLDEYRNPVNGKYIGKDKAFLFWERILGSEQLRKLTIISKKLEVSYNDF